MVGLIVIAFCSRHGPLWLGAILIGLGGITFHLAQARLGLTCCREFRLFA